VSLAEFLLLAPPRFPLSALVILIGDESIHFWFALLLWPVGLVLLAESVAPTVDRTFDKFVPLVDARA